MPKLDENYDYKKEYEDLLIKYESQETIIKELEEKLDKQSNEILIEIKNCLFDSNGKPQKQVIEYAKKVNEGMQSHNMLYKQILKIVYIVVDIILALVAFIVLPIYIYDTRDFSSLVIYFYLFMLAVIMYLSHLSLKEKTESDAFNTVAILIALTSLIISVVK